MAKWRDIREQEVEEFYRREREAGTKRPPRDAPERKNDNAN